LIPEGRVVKSLSDLVLLGDRRLYQNCIPVIQTDLREVREMVADLKNVVLEFQQKYSAGRAIAAPQLGYMYRVIYMNKPIEQVFINPVLHDFSEEMMELWDDCMSFPNLLVRVQRHMHCRITFRDQNWNQRTWNIEHDQSELLQHECNHLNGILCIQRAVDHRSFKWRISAT